MASQKFQKLRDMFVSVGAAVVIFGAWAKILHLSFADVMLTIGLLTEAAIFLLYAFVPDSGHGDDGHGEKPKAKTPEIDWDTFKIDLSKMSGNFQKLGTTVNQISELGDVVKSTGEFGNKAKEAANSLGSITTAVNVTTQSLSSFNAASENTKQFHSQVQVLTKNLSSLNTIYELELQESNNHLKALNQFYGKLAQASAAMNTSAEDAMKAKEQIAALANNLGRLNQVYGNMLTAMQAGR